MGSDRLVSRVKKIFIAIFLLFLVAVLLLVVLGQPSHTSVIDTRKREIVVVFYKDIVQKMDNEDPTLWGNSLGVSGLQTLDFMCRVKYGESWLDYCEQYRVKKKIEAKAREEAERIRLEKECEAETKSVHESFVSLDNWESYRSLSWDERARCIRYWVMYYGNGIVDPSKAVAISEFEVAMGDTGVGVTQGNLFGCKVDQYGGFHSNFPSFDRPSESCKALVVFYSQYGEWHLWSGLSSGMGL